MNPKSSSSDFRVPADWEPLDCVWLAWPHNANTWPGEKGGVSRLSQMPKFFAHLVHRIAETTPVKVLVSGDLITEAQRSISSQRSIGDQQSISSLPNVTLIDIPTNDVWIRDYGPTFVQRRSTGEMLAIDWRYNAWGGKYPPWDADAGATQRLCQSIGLPRISSKLCVEGGAMEFDGDRRMLTTPMCLLGPTRNPGWNAEQIADEIYERTGVSEIVWIDGSGLEGDDTDGHVDQLARFIDPQNVVVAVAREDDPNHDGLMQNRRQLQRWADSTRPQVTIHPLMIPPPRHVDGMRVPESYCNFLRLGPDRILMPSFSAETDDRAADLLQRLSGATIDRIDCCDLVWGLGALHCCSRDQPITPSFQRPADQS